MSFDFAPEISLPNRNKNFNVLIIVTYKKRQCVNEIYYFLYYQYFTLNLVIFLYSKDNKYF